LKTFFSSYLFIILASPLPLQNYKTLEKQQKEKKIFFFFAFLQSLIQLTLPPQISLLFNCLLSKEKIFFEIKQPL
jgi:hypothetical protein